MSVQYVRIYYGPYESFYNLSHKPQKLRGLRDHLQKLGFRVDLVPVEFINYCMIDVAGYEVEYTSECIAFFLPPMKYHQVFRCNITNLLFNTPAELDPVCQRAIRAVVSSSAKLSRARTYLWFWALLEDQTFRRDDFAPKDVWMSNADVQKLIKPLDCIICCKEYCKVDLNT